MAIITKDLGAVSAYALAVEAGYTGTKEEFAALMADYANVAQRAEDAADEAERQAGLASGSASDASTAASAAVGAKEEAETAQGAAVSAKNDAVSAKNDAVLAKTAAQTAQGLAETAQTAAETAQGKAEDAQEAAETAAETIGSQIPSILEDIDNLTVSKADAIHSNAHGSIAYFTDAVAAPMALDIVINPKISGYTSVTVTRTGRNLLKDTSAEYPQTNKGVTATKNSDDSITITGSGTGSSDSIIVVGLTADLKLVTGEQYIMSGCPSGGSNDTYRLRIAAPAWANDTGSGVTITPTGTYGSTQVQIVVKKGYTLPAGGVTFKPMIRPARDTDYEITLPDEAGTVYGGNLHINPDGSAVLTVTHGHIASYAGETLPGTWISDRDEYASDTTPTTGAQVVYALASSQSYPFTATQISSLFGENNVWADTGDVTVEYTADTKLYIERLTQPDADWIADANIDSGKFFMVGNRLFISTSAIASGETITPGTNCTETNLAAALNTINA